MNYVGPRRELAPRANSAGEIDEFCIKNDEFCIKMMNFVLNILILCRTRGKMIILVGRA